MWLEFIVILKCLDMSSGIGGGTIANFTKYNFIVSVQNASGYHFFAGVVISLYHVLSTCAELAEVTEVGVLPIENLGNIQLAAGASLTNPEQIRYPERAFIHPACKLGPDIIQYDLAMYKVFEPWDFEGTLKPALLPTGHWMDLKRRAEEMSANSAACTVIGWGNFGSTTFFNILEAQLELCSWKQCKKYYCKRCNNLEGANFCTKPKKRISICDGDQGGPLICQNAVWGIIAYPRDTCGEPHYHTYARTAARTSKSWISAIAYSMSLTSTVVGNHVLIIFIILTQLQVY